MSRERIGRTVLVAASVALACSLVVSTVVIYLRPMQLAWVELDRNRVILDLAGLAPDAGDFSDREVAARFRELDVVLIDLATGWPDSNFDPLLYDPRDARNLAPGVAIPQELDIAKLGRRANLAPVYLRVENGSVRYLILPLWGQGMWAPMRGLLALRGDCNTVAGIDIYEHGETPGIGDRIDLAKWRASWSGRKAFGPDGRVMLAARGSGRLSAGEEAAHAFDAISGATVTVNAVSRMVRYWLGEHGFGPFLARCRSGEVSLP